MFGLQEVHTDDLLRPRVKAAGDLLECCYEASRRLVAIMALGLRTLKQSGYRWRFSLHSFLKYVISVRLCGRRDVSPLHFFKITKTTLSCHHGVFLKADELVTGGSSCFVFNSKKLL